MKREHLPSQKGNDGGAEKVSRRGFLKGSALAAGAFAGAAGGFAERELEGLLGKQAEKPMDPIQDQLNKRHAKFVEAVKAGDEKAIKLGMEVIKRYSDELQRLAAVYAELQNRIPQLPEGGSRALLENEAEFNRERQAWFVDAIKNLRDPIDVYLEKRKSLDPMPKVTPGITPPGKNNEKISI